MRDPTGKKKDGRCRCQIGRALRHRIDMQQVPAMVQGHDDHHQPSGEVDRINAGWFTGCHAVLLTLMIVIQYN